MTGPEVVVRRATPADRPAILALLADSLGWDRDDAFAEFFDWKHNRNPFGASPAWVAVADDRIVGFRTFLRWEFEHPDGRTPARGARRRHRHLARVPGPGHLPVAHDDRGRGAHPRERRLRVQHTQRQQPPGLPPHGLDDRRAGSRSSPASAGHLERGTHACVTRSGRTVAGGDHRRAATPARCSPTRGSNELLESIGAPVRAPHRANSRVPAVALRPGRARLPSDRGRRRPGGRRRGVPPAAPGRRGRGGRLRRDRAARCRRAPSARLLRVGRPPDRRRLRDPGRRAEARARATCRSPARVRSSPGDALADTSAPPARRDLDLSLGDVELL